MKPIHASGADHWTRRNPEKIKRGTDSPIAKLTAAGIATIRDLDDAGLSPGAIAIVVGVSRSTVWRHLRTR